MKKNLFDIQAEYLMIMEDLEEYLLDNPDAEGEIPDHINERLFVNRNEAAEKLEAYYYVIKQLEGEYAVLYEERKRLEKKMQAKVAMSDRLREYAAQAVRQYGTVAKGSKSLSVVTDKVKLSYIATPKVEVVDEAAVPSTYKKYGLLIGGLTL